MERTPLRPGMRSNRNDWVDAHLEIRRAGRDHHRTGAPRRYDAADKVGAVEQTMRPDTPVSATASGDEHRRGEMVGRRRSRRQTTNRFNAFDSAIKVHSETYLVFHFVKRFFRN